MDPGSWILVVEAELGCCCLCAASLHPHLSPSTPHHHIHSITHDDGISPPHTTTHAHTHTHPDCRLSIPVASAVEVASHAVLLLLLCEAINQDYRLVVAGPKTPFEPRWQKNRGVCVCVCEGGGVCG